MMIPSGSKAINATFGSLVETNVNYSPVMAVIEAVEALSPKQNLELSFTFSKTNRLDHSQLPINGYTLSPLISAIEVYTASDPLVGVYTLKVDLNGLEVLISAFQQQQGYFDMLASDCFDLFLTCFCGYLSGYGLDDPLPDFSQMDDDLETVDLRNNHLDGPIQDKTSTRGQVTAVELGGVASSAMSTDALNRQSLAIEYNNS
ncbi:hypothetical protein ES332_A05G106100v1 [Gossypium tomentosum]|uniref:Malectin-like domain-containing protein n=1 Tax=Gossypium tomentosum TaxID=34277 RepID=A0A5D2QD79_GOSTO|nr:hypothetical protein ES332_A05G106100v1 [Gossypium tomentosum]